jgi:hypothetical protein
MNNSYTLDYLISGDDKPRGYFFRWLAGQQLDHSAHSSSS